MILVTNSYFPYSVLYISTIVIFKKNEISILKKKVFEVYSTKYFFLMHKNIIPGCTGPERYMYTVCVNVTSSEAPPTMGLFYL